VKFFMHKQLQDRICFNLGRRAEGMDRYVTISDVVTFLVLLVDIYALDAAARQLAVYVIVPMLGK